MAEEEGSLNLGLFGFKCASCKKDLDKAIQLPACLHILCGTCYTRNDKAYRHSSKMNCPRCGTETVKPSIANRISGIIKPATTSSATVSSSGNGPVPCDYEPFHGNSVYFCHECRKSICANCRSSHPLDHSENIMLLTGHRSLDVFSGSEGDQGDGSLLGRPAASPVDQQDSPSVSCPLCGSSGCSHLDIFSSLQAMPNPLEAYCELQDHSDQPLKYFCRSKTCWKPVCRECGAAGEHKTNPPHDTIPLEKMKDYIKTLVSDLRKRADIMLSKVREDKGNEEMMEKDLRQHVREIEREIQSQKCKALEQVTQIFNEVSNQAEAEGRKIVRSYRNQREETLVILRFLEQLSGYLNFKVDENLNLEQYNHLLRSVPKAGRVLGELRQSLKRKLTPLEQRLVLNGADFLSMHRRSQVNIALECKQPPLLYRFPISTDIAKVLSIVISDHDTCILSCKGYLSSDSIYWYKICENGKRKEAFKVLPNGEYHIAKLATGEVVAAYTYEDEYHRPMGSEFRYCSKGYLQSGEAWEKQVDRTKFGEMASALHLVPCGITTTAQNTVLVSVDLDKRTKGKSNSQNDKMLMMLSLKGEILKHIGAGAESLSLRSVAVSDEGEICACDPDNSTLVILDQNMENERRLKFSWPTSFSQMVLRKVAADEPPHNKDICFNPAGVCYDSSGRIIVVDSVNNAVLRWSRNLDAATNQVGYTVEPLVVASLDDEEDRELSNFRSPYLVALDKFEHRLWVVCRNYVYVFSY